MRPSTRKRVCINICCLLLHYVSTFLFSNSRKHFVSCLLLAHERCTQHNKPTNVKCTQNHTTRRAKELRANYSTRRRQTLFLQYSVHYTPSSSTRLIIALIADRANANPATIIQPTPHTSFNKPSFAENKDAKKCRE